MVEQRTTAEAAVGWIGVARASVATAVLFLGGLLLPIGGPLLMALTPQPGLRLSQAGNRRALTFVVALAAAGVGLAGGAAPAVFYLVSFGLLTIALPALLRRDWSIEVTIGLATAGVAVAILGVALCTPLRPSFGSRSERVSSKCARRPSASTPAPVSLQT